MERPQIPEIIGAAPAGMTALMNLRNSFHFTPILFSKVSIELQESTAQIATMEIELALAAIGSIPNPSERSTGGQ
jgi:hypothetical protein